MTEKDAHEQLEALRDHAEAGMVTRQARLVTSLPLSEQRAFEQRQRRADRQVKDAVRWLRARRGHPCR